MRLGFCCTNLLSEVGSTKLGTEWAGKESGGGAVKAKSRGAWNRTRL